MESLLKRRESDQRDWSISESLQRWQEYDSAYKLLVAGVGNYVAQRGKGVTPSSGGLLDPRTSPEPSLASFTSFILRRDFRAAANYATEMIYSDPLHLLSIIRFHEMRGAVSEALRIARDGVKNPAFSETSSDKFTIVLSKIFKLSEAYFCCYTQGRWVEAISVALDTLDYLVTSPEENLPQEPMQLVLELYCFKIFLLVVKDRDDMVQSDLVPQFATRLRQFRYMLTRFEVIDLALDVLDMEFHIQKEQDIIFELERSEYLHHRRVFVCQAEPAIENLEDFVNMLHTPPWDGRLDSSQTIEAEASARLLLCYALAENKLVESAHATWKDNLHQAWHLFKRIGSKLGQAEVALMGFLHNVDFNDSDTPMWDRIHTCLCDHGHLIGQVKFHKWKATSELNQSAKELSTSFLVPTSPSLYRQLLPVSKEMGDNLLFRTCQVRSMRNWIESASFILLCERVFHPTQGFLSDQLFLETSKLLGQLYETNNNFPESSAFALVHLQLAFSRRDSMLFDRATMSYFRCVGNMVSTIAYDDRIFEVESLIASFDRVIARMCHSTLTQMETSDNLIAAWALPIETLLWSAQLVQHITDDDGIHSMFSTVIPALYRSIKLSVDLLLLLPVMYHGLFVPAICQALGAAAEMLSNPTLALLSYNMGQSQSSESEAYMQAILLLKIGRRLTSWIYHDRQNFIKLQDVAFTYLDKAVEFFWNEGTRQASYQNGLEASVVLARAHLREVQYQIDSIDWGYGTSEEQDLTVEQRANKQRLHGHIEAGLKPIQTAIKRNFNLRRRLAGLPVMQALENRRLFYSGDMEELYWNEMGLLQDQSLLTGDPEPLMVAIQRWKAASLQDAIAQRLEPSVQATDVAMIEDPSPVNQTILEALDSGEEPPKFEESSFWDMAELAEAHIEKNQKIIFVDWTRYYDTLFMVAYDGTDGRIRKCVVEFDYHKIEQWVHRELGVISLHQGRADRKRLHQIKQLNELTPILEGLEGFVMPGNLLVLCPSGVLHAVPLHAIPFQGKPLIVANPVVYCPSFSLLQTCVNSVQDSTTQSTIPVAAFTRLGPGDPVEESRMSATAREGLSDALLQTSFASGREVTRDTFMNQSRSVRLLHYHGHTFLEPARRRDRALQLEPQPATPNSPADTGLLSVMDIFGLQLDSAVVVLLACASGEDDVAPNDDPLGLLSAFLYAGAGSVIATRWPTQTADARDFAKRFYSQAFSSRKDLTVNLATAFQAAVLSMWEDWDEDDPYHWAQFQLYGSWFGKI